MEDPPSGYPDTINGPNRRNEFRRGELANPRKQGAKPRERLSDGPINVYKSIAGSLPAVADVDGCVPWRFESQGKAVKKF